MRIDKRKIVKIVKRIDFEETIGEYYYLVNDWGKAGTPARDLYLQIVRTWGKVDVIERREILLTSGKKLSYIKKRGRNFFKRVEIETPVKGYRL
jgi:hypothetical protein